MLKNIVGALDKGAGVLDKLMIYLTSIILFLMMAWGTVDVAGRKLFNKPLYGTVEVFSMMLPAMVLLGLAYAQHLKTHIGMDMLTARLPKRSQIILSIITTLIILMVAVLFFWQGIVFVFTYRQMNMLIPTIHVPQYLPQIVVPVGSIMLIYVLIVQLVQYFIQLVEQKNRSVRAAKERS